jgi:hypothetical protein
MAGSVSITIPQGLRSNLFGFSPSSGSLADTFWGYTDSSDQTANLLKNLGPNTIAIGGRQFVVDTSFEPYRREAFKHKTIPSQRQSINLTNVSGQGTINTEGLWRREQTDWSMGAGQKYLDRNQQSMENRFYQSKGVDAFAVPNQLTLLNATKQIKNSANTNLGVTRCGTYMYVIDGNAVYESSNWFSSSPSWAAMTYHNATGHGTPTAFYSIDSNGSFVFVATDTGIWYYRAGGSGGTLRRFECYAENHTGTNFTGYNLVRWCNERVVAASGTELYHFETTHATWPTPGGVPSGADIAINLANSPDWVWSDACPGSANIYACGYIATGNTGYSGAVYRIGMDTTSSPPTLKYPIQTLPLSPDEYPTCIQNYLNYVFLGTNRGIRMCQTLNAYDPSSNGNGDLKAGPLIPNQLQQVTSPVRAITADGRYVWFGWSNYDDTSTGLGKLDLTTFIESQPLTPAYQSDLMVSGSGEILDTVYDPLNSLVIFAVSGKGFYCNDSTKYVSSGYIKTGAFTYGIPDHKIPVFFDYGVDQPDDTPAGATPSYVYAEVQVEPFDPSRQHTLVVPAAAEGQSEQTVTGGASYLSETFQTVLYIVSDNANATTPTVYRWTLKAWPAAVSETEIHVPLQLHVVNTVDGLETYSDPYEQFMFLEDLRKNQTIVQYQESTLTANVVVDSLEWAPFKRQGNYEGGFEGDLVANLKTIGGYNPYNGFPTE